MKRRRSRPWAEYFVERVGTQDGLAAANKQLDESFKTFSVAHTFETYEGDHTNRVPERIEQKVLPFFSNNLSFTAPRK